MRSLLLFLALCASSAQAGLKTPAPGSSPSARASEPTDRCSAQTEDVSDASKKHDYGLLLAARARSVPEGTKMCGYGDVTVTVTRQGRRLITAVRNDSVINYDPSDLAGPVTVDWSSWIPPVCPPSTTDLKMLAMLERLYACFPEEGYSVTSPTTDPALEPPLSAEQVDRY